MYNEYVHENIEKILTIIVATVKLNLLIVFCKRSDLNMTIAVINRIISAMFLEARDL